MEFDTLITYVLLFFFFLLPSILKRRKKKAAPGIKKKSILPGKLGDAVREFFQEMERQVLEAKKAAQQAGQEPGRRQAEDSEEKAGAGSIWEVLNGGDRSESGGALERETRAAAETLSPEMDIPEPSPAPRHPDPLVGAPKKAIAGAGAERTGIRRGGGQGVKAPCPSRPAARSMPVQAALPAHALQQAVIWSEILGPPKGLQD